jgi:type II secretory ATPase GspE/PulE/Tfp pilus assembly ATPase PilB-like protein
VCPECSVSVPSDPALLERLGSKAEAGDSFAVGDGCAACNMTGYRGRTGIFELMTISEEVKNLILQQTSSGVIREAAVRGGMKVLREDGLEKARKGITTLSEVIRVSEEE